MSRILSQEEVEALLKGIQTGRISTESKNKAFEVRPYDFREVLRPLRGAPGLERIFQKFSISFRNSLSTLLYKPIEVIPRPLEYVRFSELKKMIPSGSSISSLRLNPLNGGALFILEAGLVFAFVELFFGGRKVRMQAPEQRPFTSTEERVAKRVVLLAMNDLSMAWRDLVVINPEFSGFETEIDAVGIATPSEAIIKAEFQVNIDEFSGKAFLIIPFSVIEPFAEQVFRKVMVAEDREWIEALKRVILEAELEVSVELARFTLTFGELLHLKPGDVLTLSRGTGDELPVKVQGIKKFSGIMGSSRGSHAVRITAIH